MGIFGIVKFVFTVIWIYVKTIFKAIKGKTRKSVRGEIVLVTGAAHGMGRKTALQFANLGATVIVCDVNEKGCDETKKMINSSGGVSYSYHCDVSDKESVKNLGNQIRSDVGDVTILVNNAGVINHGDILEPSDKAIKRLFDINILAHFWTIREFLPHMKETNHGHLVHLASIAGVEGAPFMVDYCASKHAVVGLTKALRHELHILGKSGIKITCMCPYFVNTGFVTDIKSTLLPVLSPEEVVKELMDAVLLEKFLIVLPKSYQPWNFMPFELYCFLANINNPQWGPSEETKKMN